MHSYMVYLTTDTYLIGESPTRYVGHIYHSLPECLVSDMDTSEI